MNTTQNTTTNPTVAPPAGAEFVDEWQPGPPTYRVIFGPTRLVGEAEVHSSVTQFADGTIDRSRLSDDLTQRHEALIEEPKVHVGVDADLGLTVDQATELAAVIIDAIAEIGRWTRYPWATQASGGSIDQGNVELARGETRVAVLNTDQARELAAALLDSVALVDRWATK
jgi:hypothetical protein